MQYAIQDITRNDPWIRIFRINARFRNSAGNGYWQRIIIPRRINLFAFPPFGYDTPFDRAPERPNPVPDVAGIGALWPRWGG